MDPWVEGCQRLESAGARYLIVGTFGVNLFADTKSQRWATEDCDLHLPPDPQNLALAMRALRELGYDIEAGGEPLVDEDPLILRNVVAFGARVLAQREEVRIDLPLQIAGPPFEELWARQRRFVVEGVPLRVASLADIVRSKELADRPKDRLFLESFRAELRELIERERAPEDAPPPPE